MNLRNKKVLVLGMGETGLSMVKWLTRQGAEVRAADNRTSPPNRAALEQLIPVEKIYSGPFRAEVFDDIEIIAISPGVSLAEPLVQQAVKRDIPVVGDIELFAQALEELEQPRPRILAITGSNGKTTVTTMVGEMVRNAGWDVEVAGNIGPAVLESLMRRMDLGKLPQYWVLELSSFQLETTQNLGADAAAVLNLSEDHFDRYAGMHDYAAAKARLFIGDKKSVQILNRDDETVCAMALPGRKQMTFGLDEPISNMDFGLLQSGADLWLVQGGMYLLKANEMMIPGMHNIANALAAMALCRAITLPYEPLLKTLREFKGLPHRMQKIAVINNVTFYDDSKSTNVGSAIAALNGMQKNVVLIAGGDGKGQDFSPLKQPVANSARAVVLLGRDAKKIAEVISDCQPSIHYAATMDEAVRISFLLAQPGDVVMLSPACASLDMFRNYIHRAEVFIAAVKEIEEKFIFSDQESH
ncbi:UDP-N-acetylmuramoyl-L-alanine--D-glutamate ligase [Nitrosomonas sp. Is37]|uniref:UDP-N-acetylmuramoyl-L-alanine--D-glutamate ligase n=1 Tax=Nitrosomonas sp. Is37 TaxID=3080535 RepID=UPI00294B3D4F|nr:UDP-N-acetylmuramoyl-L-alanine--D-glutamate ligase [Nitrosomonas sp. Is37]MDV6344988.1 UDP-N-acetylmuramoyl-L-alanine--D-glutamate ligase [Nitrosomonas sp. Is37]